MAKIRFENGTVVNFEGNPTQADIEEVAVKLGIQKAPEKQASGFQGFAQAVTKAPLQFFETAKKATAGIGGALSLGLGKLTGSKTLTDIGQAGIKETMETTPGDYGYFGKVSPMGVDEKTGKMLSTKDAVLQSAGVGLELGSYLIAPPAAKLGVQGAKQSLFTGAKQLAKYGALGGGAAGLGIGLQDVTQTDDDLKKEIGDIVANTAIGTGAGGVLGFATPYAVKGVSKPFTMLNRQIRSRFTPTTKMIEAEQKGLREAYEEFFAQRESTNAKNMFFKERGKNPAEVLTKYGIIPDLESVNGKTIVRTKGEGKTSEAISDLISFRANSIQGTLDKISEEVLSTNIPIKQLEQKALREAEKKVSGLELKSTLNKIKQSFASLRLKYGDDLSLGNSNRVRILANEETKAFIKPQFERDAFSVIGDVLRKHIDDTIDDPIVRQVNAEIGDLITARKMLESLDGKNIGGGRMTNLIASLAGSMFGAITTKDSGIVTQLVSSLAATLGIKAFLRTLSRGAFGGASRERILSHLVNNPDLVNKLISKEPKIIQEGLRKEFNVLLSKYTKEFEARPKQLPEPKAGVPNVEIKAPITPVPPTTFEKGVEIPKEVIEKTMPENKEGGFTTKQVITTIAAILGGTAIGWGLTNEKKTDEEKKIEKQDGSEEVLKDLIGSIKTSNQAKEAEDIINKMEDEILRNRMKILLSEKLIEILNKERTPNYEEPAGTIKE